MTDLSLVTDLAKLSTKDLIEMVLKSKAEAAAAEAKARRSLTLKVSEKGAIMLLGIRQFPVTFYVKEWERILGQADAILAFAKANEHLLSKGRIKS